MEFIWLVLVLVVVSAVVTGVIIYRLVNNTSVAAGRVGRNGDIKCPKCKEFVKFDAEVCRHCGFDKIQETAQPAIRAVEENQAVLNAGKKIGDKYMPYIVVSFVFTMAFSYVYVPLAWLGVLALAVVGFLVLKETRAARNKPDVGN